MTAADFDRLIIELHESWKSSLINDAQFVALYVIAHCKRLDSRRWLQGIRKKPAQAERTIEPCGWRERSVFISVQKAIPELAIYDYSLAQFFANQRLKGVRDGALRALTDWLLDKSPLFAIVGPMSTEDVLRWQSRGARCVSVFLPPCSWDESIVGEKNPLQFTLHDLDHAYKFLQNESDYFGQVGFFDCIRILKENAKGVGSLCVSDSRFENEFSYLMSDMNTHCAHQMEYFGAIVVQALLRKYGLPPDALLNKQAMTERNSILVEIESLCGLPLLRTPSAGLVEALITRGRMRISKTVEMSGSPRSIRREKLDSISELRPVTG